MTWEQAAKMCEDVYGIFVNWEEEYFICEFNYIYYSMSYEEEK